MNITSWQRDVLNRGNIYRVGGCVRDSILTRPISDEDYVVTCIPASELQTLLTSHGRVKLVGKSFGVFKFTPADGVEVDIALPRTETSTGHGHRDFDVQCDHNLSIDDDLRRRDFTINAIAQDIRTGNIVDPFNGRRDLVHRRLTVVFEKAFEEDPLRILRGARFAARFDLVVSPETFDLMRKSAHLLSTISSERIAEEINKLFEQAPCPSVAFEILRNGNCLWYILPELDRCIGVEQNKFHDDDVYWHTLKAVDFASRPLIRWAALCHDLGKPATKRGHGDNCTFHGHEFVSAKLARNILSRFRYSNEFTEKVVHLVEEHMFRYDSEWTDASVRRFMNKVGVDNLSDLFDLRRADRGSRGKQPVNWALTELRNRITREMERENAFTPSQMAINGHDIMTLLGIEPGPRVGKILRACFELVIETPSMNTKENLTNFVLNGYRIFD